MDWFDLLAAQGTLKSFPTPQFTSINSSVLSFLDHPTLDPYVTTGKTIALTRWTFVGKVKSLLLNMLSRLVITFIPRSKHFFNFMAAVIICSDFGHPPKKKIKSATVATVSPSISHEEMGPDAIILVF